jgi:hypothetical protein
LSVGKIDLKRRIVGKGKRHFGNMKARSKNLRSRRLGHLDICLLDVVDTTTILVGQDVRYSLVDGSTYIVEVGIEGCCRRMQCQTLHARSNGWSGEPSMLCLYIFRIPWALELNMWTQGMNHPIAYKVSFRQFEMQLDALAHLGTTECT